MLLRKMRWLCAGLLATVALLAAPSRSMADTIITITEYDGSNTAVATQTSTGPVAFFNAAPNFTGIIVTGNAGFQGPPPPETGTLSSSVTSGLSNTFDPTHYLQVTISNNGYSNPHIDQPAEVTNHVGNSSGIASGGPITATGTTQIFDPTLTTALNVPTDSSIATDPPSSYTGDTSQNIGSLPEAYSIQQVLVIRVSSAIPSGSTLSVSQSSTVLTNAAPVPAPAGLILALAAVPMFGLRRALRRKVAETTV